MQRDGERARTGAHIEHTGGPARAPQRDTLGNPQGGFHHVLSLGPGDQHVGRDAELAAIKLLPSGDVLGRLALQPFVKIAAKVEPLHLVQFLLGVREWVNSLAAERVREEHFGGQARHADSGILQQAGTLKQGRLDGHGGISRFDRSGNES